MRFKNIKPLCSRETHIHTDESGVRRCREGFKIPWGRQRKLSFSRYRFWMNPKLCFIEKVDTSSCLQSLGHLAEFPPQSVYRINDSLFLS